MTRKLIRHRNAVTELWNHGASMDEMTLVLGLPEQKIKAYLASARNGFNTPADQQAALDAANEKKAARK